MTSDKLSFQDMRTLGLAALGGALEFYDFVIFVFFTKTLGSIFFPSDMPSWLSQLQVYGIFAAGYIARPIGGIVMAHFGDLLGRKRMFTLSVLLMSFPTLCIGLLPTYTHWGVAAPLLLLFLRVMQGFAIGGEVPAAWVFVSEHVPKSRIGFACASLTSGLTLGILIGSLVGRAVYTQLSPEDVLSYGWRLAFILGGVFGIMAVYLRGWLKETPVFEAMKERKELSAEVPLKVVLKEHKPAILISMLITWMLTAGIMVLILMTPTLIQSQFNISSTEAFKGNNIAAFLLVIGCLVGGLSADKIGFSKALGIGTTLLLIMSYLLYIDLQNGGVNFITLYGITGFTIGVVGVVPAVLVTSYPPVIRFTGVSFSYNMSYAIFGGMTPPFISYLSSHFGGLAPAHYVATSCITTIIISIYLISKSTKEFAF